MISRPMVLNDHPSPAAAGHSLPISVTTQPPSSCSSPPLTSMTSSMHSTCSKHFSSGLPSPPCTLRSDMQPNRRQSQPMSPHQPIPITASPMDIRPPALPPKPNSLNAKRGDTFVSSGNSYSTDFYLNLLIQIVDTNLSGPAGTAPFPIDANCCSSSSESALMSLRREDFALKRKGKEEDATEVILSRPKSLCATSIELESTIG